MKEWNPLPATMQDTQEVMTVYKISKSTKIIDGILRSKNSYPYKIYS